MSGKIFVVFRMAFFCYGSLMSSFWCYCVIFLESSRHIQPGKIGVMISLYTMAAFAGQSLWGFLCDKIGSIKIVLWFQTLAGMLVVITFPFNHNFVLLCMSMFLSGLLLPTISPLIDSWVLKKLSKGGSESKFGKIRLFSSAGWAITAFFLSYLIMWSSLDIIYVNCAAFGMLFFLTLFFIDDSVSKKQIKTESNLAKKKAASFTVTMKVLFANKIYVFIVLVMFCHFLGVQTAYTYLALIIKQTGGGVLSLGLTYLLDAGMEVPAMFLSQLALKKYQQKSIMIIAILLYLVRFAIILFFRTPASVTLSSLLQGFAFGLIYTALRNYIYTIAPDEFKTTAVTCAEAVYLYLAVIIGSLVGGFIIDQYGVFCLLFMCICSIVTGLIFLVWSITTQAQAHSLVVSRNQEMCK